MSSDFHSFISRQTSATRRPSLLQVNNTYLWRHCNARWRLVVIAMTSASQHDTHVLNSSVFNYHNIPYIADTSLYNANARASNTYNAAALCTAWLRCAELWLVDNSLLIAPVVHERHITAAASHDVFLRLWGYYRILPLAEKITS